MCWFFHKRKETVDINEYSEEKYKYVFDCIFDNKEECWNMFNTNLSYIISVILSGEIYGYIHFKDMINTVLYKFALANNVIKMYSDKVKIINDFNFLYKTSKITSARFILSYFAFDKYLKTINEIDIEKQIDSYISSYDEKKKNKGGK